MAVNIYAPSNTDGLESEEIKLVNLINDYRAQHGLLPIQVSDAMNLVSNRHVLDLAENIGSLTHGWSDAPYDNMNPATYDSMWNAPQRFATGYVGQGYENAHWFSAGATADSAFQGWKNSFHHNNVILNRDIWTNYDWNALGVGIYKGYAVMWVGQNPDPSYNTLAPVNGTAASEQLWGTTGNDRLYGRDGNDELMGLAGNDYLYGEAGDDKMWGYEGSDRLSGGLGNDTLSGNEGDDAIAGGAGNDLLFGDSGNDTLIGGAGGDILLGVAGHDALWGNEGGDFFYFAYVTDGIDTIKDFNRMEGDKLAVWGQAFQIDQSQVGQFSYNSSTGAIYFGQQHLANLTPGTAFDVNQDIVVA